MGSDELQKAPELALIQSLVVALRVPSTVVPGLLLTVQSLQWFVLEIAPFAFELVKTEPVPASALFSKYPGLKLSVGVGLPRFQRFARLLAMTWLFMFHIWPVPLVPVALTAAHVLVDTSGYHVPVNPCAVASD